MIEKVPAVVGEASAESWRFLLRGLYNSGLRIGEAMELDWTDDRRLYPVDFTDAVNSIRTGAVGW